jgi:CheY-like chemotaxis protein
VLRQVRSTLEPLAARTGLSLEVAMPTGPLPLLAADRVRFAQVLMNFGSNAIKYNRQGGKVTLAVSQPDASHIRVTVTDTGIGIPADKQAKLFQPFQRAGQETGSIEGTGIGLVITKRLAELMGGSVGFRSVAGEGSEFWVDMPIHAAEAPRSTTAQVEPTVTDRLGTGGTRLVLYVEDNPANVLFMQDLLGSFDDIELVTAPTAEFGLEIARARAPAVILMDINLPGMSGLDALNALRAIPETSKIPVIALTAAASERDRQRGEEAGFFRYLTKPVKVDELETALGKLLGNDAPGSREAD